MNKREAFEKLKDYSKNLSAVSYEEIYDLFTNGIKFIPLPLAKVRENVIIDRARQNIGNNLFKNINELGYIKDKNVIQSSLISYGRANKPHQVMFYGALQTELINRPRLTAIAETSHLFNDSKIDCLDGEYYTISRWETQKEFLVVEVVFSEYAMKNNPDINRSFENQKKLLQSHNLTQEEIEFQLEYIKLISEEFSKPVSDPEEYKISAAYTNLVLLHSEAKGITYPSVQTDYFGVNIVLTPDAVDNCLKPTVCSTQILYKKGLTGFIANGEHYCDKIDLEKDLNWQLKNEATLTSKEVAVKLLD
jgi:hypothetical protein